MIKNMETVFQRPMPTFTIKDQNGELKQGITRGFLSTVLMTREDLKKGVIVLDCGYEWQLFASNGLIRAIEGRRWPVKAICSFQEHLVLGRIAVAQILKRKDVV